MKACVFLTARLPVPRFSFAVSASASPEYPVTFPQLQVIYSFLIYPDELSLIAVDKIAIKTVRGIKEHILCNSVSGYKSNDPSEISVIKCAPCLFQDFSSQTFIWTLILFKMPADSDPLVFVYVMLLLHAVEHQILSILLDVAECRKACHNITTV